MHKGATVSLTRGGICEVWMYSLECCEFDECERIRGVVTDVVGDRYIVELTLDGEHITRSDDNGDSDTWNFTDDEVEEE